MIPFAQITVPKTKSAKARTAKKKPKAAQNDTSIVICGAKTRAGHPCRMPPVKGKTRCRMHGGTTQEAKNAGAPQGNRNALLHGYYSAEARAERKRLAGQLRWLKKEMKEMRKLKGL